MELIAVVFAVAVALFYFLRTPGVFSPALVAENEPGTTVIPGDDDEQMPETDRAPRSWLPLTVAAVGLVRVAFLVTLHA
jgi:hypothetical protein